jgi:DNA-binding response OmpR family regulator
MASIIVTDDDALIRTTLSDALTLVGHAVFLAENGNQQAGANKRDPSIACVHSPC